MLKFLVLLSFSVACVMILREEQKTVVYRSKREFRSFYNRTFLENFDFRPYNLTSADGQKRFLSEIENLYADKADILKRLFCLPVRELFKNESELQLGEPLTDQLVARLNRSFYNFLLSSSDNQTEARLALFELTILRSIRSNNYYIYRDQICAIQEPFFGEQLAKIFERPRYYVLVEGFSKLLRLRAANENAVIYVVLNEENPNSHCAGADHKRSRCLNECLKKSRLSKYFYNASSRGTLIIDYEPGNRSIAAHERACFKKCKHRCKLIVYERHGNESRSEMTTFMANPSMSTFSFWVNFFGFFFSFFSVSCHKLLMKLVRVLVSRVLNKTSILALKIVLTMACFVVLLLLSGRTVFEYLKERNENPVKRHVTSTSFVPFDLVVCVPIDYILQSGNYSNHSGALSMASLEERTKSAFDDTVDDVYLSHRDEHFAFSWRLVKEKVQFYKVNNSLSRCFHVEIEQESPRYRKLLSANKLRVSFKHHFYSVFVLAKGQSLSSANRPYGGNNERDLVHKLSSKPGRCRKYDETPLSRCRSRWNCFDLCVANKSIEQNLNLSAEFVINKTPFTKRWANLFIDSDRSDGTSEIRKRIETECERAFPLLDCVEVFYKHDRSTTGVSPKVLQIDVTYLVIQLVEGQNGFQLLQELLLLQCVVFNFNICQMAIIFILFKFHLKQNRTLLYLVYFICLAGFVAHNWAVLFQLRNEKLVQSQILEELEFFEMPTVAFCFDYDQSAIAGEHNLTGNKLERLTESINPVAAFRQIIYLDKSNREVRLNLSRSSLPTTKLTEEELCRIKTFYYLSKKCLAIELKISYEPYAQFYFEDEQANVVLKVDFNRRFLEQHQVLSFLTKRRGRMYLSELVYLDYTSADRSYLAEQTGLDYYYEDKFRLFKQPLSLFGGSNPDADEYLAELRESFRKMKNFATLDLPLESDWFDLQINSTLFREFYYREHYPRDRQVPDDLVYQSEQTLHTISEGDRGLPNFQFSAKNVKYIHVNRSENQWCKTILSFLNGLFFYLNMKMFQTFFFKLNDLKSMSDGLLRVKSRACDQAANEVAPICLTSGRFLPELRATGVLLVDQPASEKIERRTALSMLNVPPKRTDSLRRTFSVSVVSSDEAGIFVSDNVALRRTPSL